jgi:hypothetical protein
MKYPLTSYTGRLFKDLTNLRCLVLLVLIVAAATVLAVKMAKDIQLAGLPCQPSCLFGPPALFVPLSSTNVLLKCIFLQTKGLFTCPISGSDFALSKASYENKSICFLVNRQA